MNMQTWIAVLGVLTSFLTLRCVLLYTENKRLADRSEQCYQAAEFQTRKNNSLRRQLADRKLLIDMYMKTTNNYNTDEDPIEVQTFGPLYEPTSIGIAGPARSGKDTAANYLLSKLGPEWSSVGFADPIKEMLGVIGVDCSDEKKHIVDPRFGKTPRFMMQTLGTEWGRGMIKDSIWEDIVEDKIAQSPRIVKDIRFDGEASMCRKYGPVLHMLGRGGIPGQHRSESGVEFEFGDTDVNNSSEDKTRLYSQLDWLVEKFKK